MAAAAFAAAADARETEDDDDPSFTTAGAVTPSAPEHESDVTFRRSDVRIISWKEWFRSWSALDKVVQPAGARDDRSATTAADDAAAKKRDGIYVPDDGRAGDAESKHGILEATLPGVKGTPVIFTHSGSDVARDVVSRPIRRFEPAARHLRRYFSNPYVVADGEVAKQDYQLDVTVGRVQFSCHGLMRHEDYLCCQLKKCYQDYVFRERANMLEFYRRKLMTLEENVLGARDAAFDHWQDRLPEEKTSSLFHLQTLELNLADVRRKLAQEQEDHTQVVDDMKRIYAELVVVRQRQGFQSTDVELESVQEQADEKACKARCKLDVQLFIAEKDKIAGLDEYSLKAQDFFELRKVESTACSYLQRKGELQKRLAGLEDALSEENISSLTVFDRGNIERQLEDTKAKLKELGSAPLRIPHEDGVQEDVVREAEREAQVLHDRVHMAPTERMVLYSSDTQFETLEARQEDANHVKSMQRSKLSARLMINGNEVGSTEERSMNADYTIDFDWTFSVRLFRWPERARLQLYERHLLGRHVISEMQLTIPGGDGGSVADMHPVAYDFGATTPFMPTWLKSETPLYTSGAAFVHCKWVSRLDDVKSSLASQADLESGIDTSVNPLTTTLSRKVAPNPPSYVTETTRKTFKGVPVDSAQMKQWLDANSVDPNDPQNYEVIHFMDTSVAKMSKSVQDGTFSVATPADLKLEVDPMMGRKRQLLIRARWEKGPVPNQSTSVSQIPLSERAISISAKGMRKEDAYAQNKLKLSRIVTTNEALDVIHKRDAKLEEFLTKASKNMQMTKLANLKLKETRHEDVIKEALLPEIRLDLSLFTSLLEPQRKLRPSRKGFKPVAVAPDAVEIVIGVEKGMHLPYRQIIEEDENEGADLGDVSFMGGARTIQLAQRFVKALSSPASKKLPGVGAAAPEPKAKAAGSSSVVTIDHQLLRPYIEVVFQGKHMYSNISEGVNPIWNFEARFLFKSSTGKITPSKLINCREKVTINVFDLKEAGSEADGKEEGDPTKPSKKRFTGVFLGTTSVTVSSLYRARISQGNFWLEVPLLLFGYEKGSKPTRLSLYCTVKPSLALPEASNPSSISIEADDLLSHAEKWTAHLQGLSNCKFREFAPVVPNSENILHLVTRFLYKLPLPTGHSAKSMPSMRRLCKLVSLIPNSEFWDVFKDVEHTWLDSCEFIDMCVGDSKAHAITLCNYFLHEGHDAFVIAGASHSNSEAYFVGTKKKDVALNSDMTFEGHKDLMIWSPYTGRECKAKSANNELVRVYMVFNPNNIYGNVQRVDEPWHMSWDFDNLAHWCPFYGANFPPRNLGTVQRSPKYTTLDSSVFFELESSVEREVMNAITSSRGYEYTHFNRRCSRIYKSLLQDIAKSDVGGEISPNDIASILAKHADDLDSVGKMYTVHGHPMRFTLKDLNEITEGVLNTGIQHDYRENVEMAVAIHVHYTQVNYICAIWVFIAKLEKSWK